MKATHLTSILVALVISISMNAQDVKKYCNIETNEFGTLKEFISVNSETLIPLTKEFYTYNVDGKIVEKVISKWSGIEEGWIKVSKYEYTYGDVDSDLVTLVAYTKWNKNERDWSKDSELLVNVYDENNNYMATLSEK